MGTFPEDGDRNRRAGKRRLPRAAKGLLLLFVFSVCLYILRLEAHTSADVFLPKDYHSVVVTNGAPVSADSDSFPHALNTYYEAYAAQAGRPYTIRQDLLLSRLAYIKAPQGFRGEMAGISLRALCDEVERILGDPAVDAEGVFGRNRQEILSITEGIRAHPALGELVIREYIVHPSGLAGYVLEGGGEVTIALRGTDDTIDILDNALLLPFNASVQYAAMRELLAACGDAARIWLTGHSKGGHNAIYAASIDPRCRAAGFNAPGFGIFLSDAQHDGLDAGVNYVINGDVTGFLLFHMERRILLESASSAAAQGLSLNNRHRLDHFFSVDDLTVATRIQPIGIWSEWITQILWLLLVFLAAYGITKLLIAVYRRIRPYENRKIPV